MPATQPTTRTPSSNKALFRRFHDAIGSCDGDRISRAIDELVAPDVAIHQPLPVQSTGPQALKDMFERLHRAFPDLQVAVEDLIEEGDKVVGRNVVSGTHRGDYLGQPPTGRRVTYDEIFIFRFADGRIAETWGVVDVLAQLRQLGALPGGSS
jgi:steroid delta-isomerase-like uncharacterized protein